jgi:hypothetical protein
MSKGFSNIGRAVATALAVGLAAPALASAGSGIRLGGSEGRLHPFLEVEGRYDSNVFYTTANKTLGDFILHFRPGILMTVPGDATAVDLNASLDWAQYLGAEGDTTGLSRLYGDATLGIGLNRRGAIGLELSDDFHRTTNTSSVALGTAAITNFNTLKVGVPWRPGGGALVLTLGGEWVVESFEPYLTGSLCVPGDPNCDATRLSKLGYNDLRGGAELRWKFLPRTAAVLEASYFSRLPNDRSVSFAVDGFRTYAGMTGLITAKIAGTLKAGYGSTLDVSGDAASQLPTRKFQTWLANAEVEWLPVETSSLRLGYVHDLAPDPGLQTAVFQQHRAYVEGRALLAARYTLRLLGQWERRTYELGTNATINLYHVEPGVEVEVARWLRVVAAYAYTKRDSPTPGGPQAFAFDKNEAWLRFILTY